MERVRVLGTDWAENGFGSPKMVHCIYLAKVFLFYAIGGITIATLLTSGLPECWEVSQWWNQPIVYKKANVWTMLVEVTGIAGSRGPLAGKLKLMTGGIVFWARQGTIRLRPWTWIPLPSGDRRTRTAEFFCNSIIGFNFGEGHFHNEMMIQAVQTEAEFLPGECVVAWVESEAFGSGLQHYKLIDAALGVIKRGPWKVAEQPWLPNGPIPLTSCGRDPSRITAR